MGPSGPVGGDRAWQIYPDERRTPPGGPIRSSGPDGAGHGAAGCCYLRGAVFEALQPADPPARRTAGKGCGPADPQHRHHRVPGTIYDRNGHPLAVSATAENVFVDPKGLQQYLEEQAERGNTEVRDAEYIARGLSRILEVDEETILEKMEKPAPPTRS